MKKGGAERNGTSAKRFENIHQKKKYDISTELNLEEMKGREKKKIIKPVDEGLGGKQQWKKKRKGGTEKKYLLLLFVG